MDIKKIESSLKMENLFFSKCSFERKQKIADGEYNANFERNITNLGNHNYNVEAELTISKADFKLFLKAEAMFLYEADDYEREESIVNNNTIAIMFPFIRSQVSLMTTQPGMMPIVLPPINTAKLNC